MAFLAVVVPLLAVFGGLLWFTGWAEERVVAPEDPVEAKTP